MHARENELHTWLKQILGNDAYTLNPLAGDASFRRYFRLGYGGETKVIMDAPPERESTTAFIQIAKSLDEIGVRTPRFYASNSTLGFLLLEDFGDELLLNILSSHNADQLYDAAISTLLQIQKCPIEPLQLPDFDAPFMLKEISLFSEWFLKRYLSLRLSNREEQLLNETFNWLTQQIAKQPKVFIHRDYHSRNLMRIDNVKIPKIGVLDFQDAMLGSFTYDLVSLLKDCYIEWPRERVLQWLYNFHQDLPISLSCPFETLVRHFDLTGLQRHLKVLGIFSRLQLRDNKPGYLRDLPLTLKYVNACLKTYPELQNMSEFMNTRVQLPVLSV